MTLLGQASVTSSRVSSGLGHRVTGVSTRLNRLRANIGLPVGVAVGVVVVSSVGGSVVALMSRVRSVVVSIKRMVDNVQTNGTCTVILRV